MMYNAIVIGVSAGGFNALSQIVPQLPFNFSIPVIIVQHLSPKSDKYIITHLDNKSDIKVKEAEEKRPIKKGHVYFAPPNYHLLIDYDNTFALTSDDRVHYSRPSIDVLFESASEVYKEKLIGVLLTGANRDGSEGLNLIKQNGGYTIVENPKTAYSPAMPQSAIKLFQPDIILDLEDIPLELNRLATIK